MPDRDALSNRAELLESVLHSYPEGIALLGNNGQVLFWNRAAESITGFAGIEVIARDLPDALEPIFSEPIRMESAQDPPTDFSARGNIVHAQHRHGSPLCATARSFVLRDGLGERIGKAIFFHSSECQETLVHGEVSPGSELAHSLERMEDRIEELFEDFLKRGTLFGLLWITVDQAHQLRKTHGLRACEEMLDRVACTLANGLRPQEEIGRWGNDDFLVLTHERRPQGIAAFAQHLAGLTRTTDFRWWGDRLSLTVSVGAALAEANESLSELLERARAAMLTSLHAGGNHMTLAPKRFPSDRPVDSPTLIRPQPPEDSTNQTIEPSSSSTDTASPEVARRPSCSQS